MAEAHGAGTSNAPARAGLVLASLILVAAAANLNLAVANVALPSIAKEFDSFQNLLGFLTMLVLWNEGISYWKVALGYALIGIGVGFAGTPASHSLTGSVPARC